MGALAVQLARRGPPSVDIIHRMLAAVPHRGDMPEVAVFGQVAFGVTNHSETASASLFRAGDRMAVFCGTLDNAADLRHELERTGTRAPDCRCLAATVLACYRLWGKAFTSRLRGSFALAITDGREVICCRDQFGARPLFHHDGVSGFFLGTEVKQVLAGSEIRREPNLIHLHRLIFGGIVESTAYIGVERILKNSVATVGATPGVTSERYWEPERVVESSRIGPREAMEGTVEALERAVRRQLTDHSALLLSGGLDSPALAAFAARAPGLAVPVQAVTSRYPDFPSVDEFEWTRMAADHTGMPLHAFNAVAGGLDDAEYWVKMLDGPIDILSMPETAEAYRECRAAGARSVLNGEIAEFIFESRDSLFGHLLSHGRIRSAARIVGWWRERGWSTRKIMRTAAESITPPRLREAVQREKPRHFPGIPAWLDIETLFAPADPGQPVRPVGPRRAWLDLQTLTLNGPSTGLEADEICAAVCGVDSRRPFMDVDLWEFVLSLRAEVKFPTTQTKPLLRESMRGLLPDELIDRRDKTLFNAFHEATADYPRLRKLLGNPQYRIPDVDYDLLAQRLEAEALPAREIQWARDLARIHVFLEEWA